MNENAVETLPQTWDDTRDTEFFRIVADVFSHEFLYSASVLLATYDENQVATLS